MHFDQSLSGDSYGIACTYVDDVIVGTDGIPLLFLKVEWIVRINPPKPPAKIDLAKCRSIIPYLAKTYGITFGMISYDTFQSAEAMQELEKSGYPVKTRSVEEDTAYLTLCQYIYDGRIEFPRHPVFEQELFGLMHYRSRHKVDHLPGGCFSKDTKISLLDGRNLSIEELLKEQEEGKVNWVYTINEITKNIEPKPIKRIFKTKTTNDLVKVTLDSGESFICTSDHRLMTRDFNWKEAKDLVYNESMLPFSRRWYNDGEREYFLREEQVLSHYKRGRINHKVISVERVNDTLDVYDLEVQDNHNFALAAGIFAHNSKDTRRCCCWFCNERYRGP